MGKITVQNVSTATVIISDDSTERRFRRELTPGRVATLEKEDYENLMFNPGFVNLVKAHYIKLDGVSEEEAVEVHNEKVYDVGMINDFFDKKDYTGFANFLPNATMAEKDTTVELAVKKGITNPAFVGLIKKYCGVDVISAISFKHQAEEK